MGTDTGRGEELTELEGLQVYGADWVRVKRNQIPGVKVEHLGDPDDDLLTG